MVSSTESRDPSKGWEVFNLLEAKILKEGREWVGRTIGGRRLKRRTIRRRVVILRCSSG